METMLGLLAYGAAGNDCGADLKSIPLGEVIRLAAEQGVWQLCFAGIKQLVSSGKLSLDEADMPFYAELQKRFMQSCILHEQKNGAVQEILTKLSDAGIPCCLLKGKSLSYMYAHPECRISSDIDLLVSPEDEQKALTIFRESGFSVEHRGTTSNHDKLEHPKIGVVELHISLYYDIEHDVWFDNMNMQQEPFMQKDGMTVLGITDGYLYTLLHAVRHFVRSGLGVKQILDVLLYEKYYKNELDEARIRDTLTHLKYMEFLNTVKGFGVTYLGFSESDFLPFSYDAEKVKRLFEDVAAGGVFGKKEDRSDCFDLYNAVRFATFKNEDYQSFMTKWYRKKAANSFSFGLKNMKKRYPYAEKHIFLLPVAWIHHVFTIGIAVSRKISNIGKSIKYTAPEPKDALMQERMDLYKYFDMM